MDEAAIGEFVKGKIKLYRNFKGHSQEEVASKIEISHRNYQRIESGELLPKLNVLLKLAKVLDIPLPFFFAEIDHENLNNTSVGVVDDHCVYLTKDMLFKWQRMLDCLAGLVEIPAALIMRIVDKDLEVFMSSNSKDNPYKVGEKEKYIGSGLYCETVVSKKEKLFVANALKTEKWGKNPDVKFGMISYLGFPITYPNGKLFGTICVLDSKENRYSPKVESIMCSFTDMIHGDLHTSQMNNNLMKKNQELYSALLEVKELRELIPICSSCKKIRREDNSWSKIENYLEEKTGTHTTYGICPTCRDKLNSKNF